MCIRDRYLGMDLALIGSYCCCFWLASKIVGHGDAGRIISKTVSYTHLEEEKSDSDLVLSPRITIVFQKDLSDDEELSREIADMYISNRAYYYACLLYTS